MKIRHKIALLSATAIAPGSGALAQTAVVAPQPEVQAPGTSAGAQSAESAEAPAERTTLGDIVVTARKRSESAQSVPITLNAMGADALRTNGIVSLQHLEIAAPGVQLSSYSTIRPTFFIRGIGTSQVTTSVDSSVGVFVDEVYVPRMGAEQIGERDVERIEILKGPQGTLFGRNTAAGAISITSPNPTSELKGALEARVGSFRELGGTAEVSGPLSDDVGARLFLDYSRNRGYSQNLTNGNFSNGDNSFYGSVKFVYKEGASKFTLKVDYAHSKMNGEFDKSAGDSTFISLQNPALPNYLPLPDINKDYLNFDPSISRTVWRGYLRGDIPLGFADLVSLSSYYNTDQRERVESDASPLRVWSFANAESSNVYSQELRLVSNSASPLTFDGLGNWVFGLYYYNDHSNRTDWIDTYEDSLYAALGAPRTSSSFNIRIRTTSFAAYGQYDFKPLPDFTVSVGGRYTRDRKRADIDAGTDVPGLGIIPVNYSVRNVGDTWEAFDPKVTVSYKPAPEVMLYATYSQGFKSGAFQTLSPLPEFASVVARPEKVINYEVGLKSRWFDDRLQLNLAGFYDNYKNLQLQRIDGVTLPSGQTSFAVVTANAAKATVKGGEVNAILQAVPGLTLSAAYSLVIGKYENFQFSPTVDFSGNPIRNAPKHTISLAADAKHDFGGLRLTGHVDYFHKSTTYFDVAGRATQPGLIQGPYGVLNGRLAIGLPDKGWELAIVGKNLTGTKYKLMGFTLGDGGSSNFVPAPPASWQVSLRKTF
jgi:iron complex outermembrane receptor protein